jgi:hypothetical protein
MNKKVYNTSILQPKVQKVSILLLSSKFLYNARNHKRLGRFLQAQGKHNLLYTPTTYTKQQSRISIGMISKKIIFILFIYTTKGICI